MVLPHCPTMPLLQAVALRMFPSGSDHQCNTNWFGEVWPGRRDLGGLARTGHISPTRSTGTRVCCSSRSSTNSPCQDNRPIEITRRQVEADPIATSGRSECIVMRDEERNAPYPLNEFLVRHRIHENAREISILFVGHATETLLNIGLQNNERTFATGTETRQTSDSLTELMAEALK